MRDTHIGIQTIIREEDSWKIGKTNGWDRTSRTEPTCPAIGGKSIPEKFMSKKVKREQLSPQTADGSGSQIKYQSDPEPYY